jgi:hypothetical protein
MLATLAMLPVLATLAVPANAANAPPRFVGPLGPRVSWFGWRETRDIHPNGYL